MADTVPIYEKTMNRGIHMLVEMIDQYYTEAQEALQSRNGNAVHDNDVGRVKEYMDDLDKWMDYWASRSLLDLTATSGRVYLIPDLEVPKRSSTQNLFWYEYLMLLNEFRAEVRRSQSRNQAQGLHSSDVNRFKKQTENIRVYFDEYVSSILPVDRPQSSSPESHYLEDRTDYSPGEDGLDPTT
jgi:hypothetical protein